ncbi:MAG: phenylalanine--tRNA ligase subunit beta [Negativicutes bacterium]|nr:phenylalanine--tRNA ligase subunit beta [Negativicutes bacterium]
MRASIKWLKDYVDFAISPEELAERMTMAGVPVENIEYLGQGIENVVTGKIIEALPHPNADRLTVCKVDIGRETLTIVTGANNISTGKVVPVALVGAKLPSGMDIGKAVFRGVESFGMLCSAEELNLDAKILPPEVREGIMLLPDDTPLGQDIRSVLGLDDVVLEFELTPNRADCFSMLGLAREVAVLTGGTVKKPMLNLREAGEGKAASYAAITIEEKSRCARFCARILTDVKVGPSPAWLQHRIQAAGMRPINNVVDVTNFVMLEMGQPMHAYDYNLLSRHTIIVRRANPREPLTTLDGVKRELNSDMLVIADAVQAVGVAGVMGGLATEVTGSTSTVLLEAASFDGFSVRKTSRTLGLRSEASSRFERGVDVRNITRALDRAAKLLEDMGACKVVPGIIDNYPCLELPQQVNFTAKWINDYLGTEIPQAVMIDILRRLEFDVEVQGEKITVTVPSWRGDVSLPADISEEIARIYGFNNIPATTPSGRVTRGGQSTVQSLIDEIKRVLAGAGLSEILSFSFAHPSIFDKLNIPADSELRQAIEIMNPITDDFPLLRTTLLGSVMETVVRNLSRKNDDMKIFEIGSVYLAKQLPLDDLPAEPVIVCGAMTGKRQVLSWNTSRDLVDFYDAKGTVELVLERLGITGYEVTPGERHSYHPGKTAVFAKDGDVLAVVGEVHPKVLDAFAINKKVYAFEMTIDTLAKHAAGISRYQPLPKFPAVSRDLAVVLPEKTAAKQVVETIRQSGGALLADFKIFDVYTGEQVAPGMKSLAFALTFRAERTLTDEEVDVSVKQIINRLEQEHSAKIRI